LVYADDDWSVHTTKAKSEALLVGSEENGLELNADKTKYLVMSRDRNAVRSHNINIDNTSFENNGRVQIFGNKLNK